MTEKRDITNLIDADWPEAKPITEQTRQIVIENAKYHSYGNVRLATGRFYTDAEYQTKKDNSRKPLP